MESMVRYEEGRMKDMSTGCIMTDAERRVRSAVALMVAIPKALDISRRRQDSDQHERR